MDSRRLRVLLGLAASSAFAAGCDAPVAFPAYGFRDAGGDRSGEVFVDGADDADDVVGVEDAGVDVTPCAEGEERCDGACVDLRSSVAHCGACGSACAPANATASCAGGICAIGACADGFGDCDGLVANGCETDVRTSSANCGACGRACALDHATTSCVDGACRVERCEAGAGDCDGDPANGCEAALASDARNCGTCGRACSGATPACTTADGGTDCSSGCAPGQSRCGDACVDAQTSLDHCGACGNACPARANATRTCASGRCGFTCAARWADCDGNASNGCEVNLDADARNCGACGRACALANATAACVSGACRVATCASGWGNCDGADGNGCEARLNTPSNCGRCGLSLAETRCDGRDDNCNGRTDEGDVCAYTVPFGGSVQIGARSGHWWSTVRGDNEFGGHGPCVTATATVSRSSSDVSIQVCVTMAELNGSDCGGSPRDSYVSGCWTVSRTVRTTGFQPTQPTGFRAQYFDRTTNSVDSSIPVLSANRSIVRVDCNGDTNNEDVCNDEDFPGCSGCVFYLGDVRVYRAP